MKKILMGLLVVVTLMVLGTCNPFQGPDTDGTITLHIGNRSARAVPDPVTVQPTLEYQFTATNGTKMETVTLKRTTTGSMALSPGTWDITAKAYLPGGTVLVGTGRPNPLAVKVVAGQNTTAAFTMVFENTEIDTLTVMDANNRLSPTFDPDTATYTVVIPPGVTNITVEATPKVAGAELSYYTNTSTTGVGLAIDTPLGQLTTAIPGVIEIDVKGSSGYTTTYTVTFVQIINALGALADITAPVHDATSTTAIIPAGTGYTGTFAWTSGLSSGTSGTYVYGTDAVAEVTLNADTGYTFTRTTIDAAAIQAVFTSGSPAAAITSNTGAILVFTLTYTVAPLPLSGTVSITGTAQWNQVLTADISSLTPSAAASTYTYQWKRDGTTISGATSQTYTLIAADEGKTISVEVSRTGYTPSITGTMETAVNSIGGTGQAGGKIFYVTTAYPGKTYLEAALTDIGNRAWASSGYTATPISGTEDDIGKGAANTTTILATDPNAPAAKACADYSYGGYDDWFLPSVIELSAMRINQSAVGGFTINPGEYWSSTQHYYNTDQAKFWYFNNAGQTVSSKSNTFLVRAVRAF